LVEVGGVRAPSAILNTVAGLGCSVRNCWFGDASDAVGTVVGSANWITWQGDGIEISGCHVNGAGNNKYGAVKINGATNGVTITANYFSNFDYVIDLGSSVAYNVTVISNRTRNMASLSRGTIGGGTFLSQEFVFAGTFQTGPALQNSGAYHSNSTETAFRANSNPSTLLRVDATSLGFVAGDLSRILRVQSSASPTYETGIYATQYSAFIDTIGWRFTTQIGSGVSRNALLITDNVTPGQDNVSSLGEAALRWTTVYATTPTISTSDEREKQQIRLLTDAEKAVAVRLKGLVKAFKFNEAVAKKGGGARVHFGWIAQEVILAFSAEGLDATQYGLLCYDAWDEYTVEHSEVLKVDASRNPILDTEGNLVIETHARTEVVPAGNRYGVRYEELLAFIISVN
jgi:hypothetical protein